MGSALKLKSFSLLNVCYMGHNNRFFSSLLDDVSHFKSILGDSRVLTEDIEGYNVDWLGSVRGQSECVLKPKTTEEISKIIRSKLDLLSNVNYIHGSAIIY